MNFFSFSFLNYDTMPLCTPASSCPFYYNISGNVHQDTTTSCINDSLTPGATLHAVKIMLMQNNQVVQQCYSFNDGGYTFQTDSLSDYQVQLDTTGSHFYTSCPSNNYRDVQLSVSDSLRNNESFGVKCGSQDFSVISIYSNLFRIFLSSKIRVLCGNNSTIRYGMTCETPASGIITTSITGSAYYVSPALGALTPSQVTGRLLSYNIADLNAIQPGDLDIILAPDSNAPIGSTVCVNTTIFSNSDVDQSNNSLTSCFYIINSYDPNLKEVYPTALQQNKSEWLTYTIHFQNTGNDTAYTVVLRDTLDNGVMPESFQYLASSHHAVIQLFGKAMVFTFPKINLVDSATNPPLSQGWIQYKVKTKPNLPINTVVRNTAYIYFDLNPAVVTNTASSTVTITGVNTIADENSIRLYPNPNGGSFVLETTNATGSDYQVYDMVGSLIAQGAITTDHQQISMTDVAAGVYTLQVRREASIKQLRVVIEK